MAIAQMSLPTGMSGTNNPFMDYLNYEPRTAYYSSPGSRWAGTSPGRTRYFQNQFQDVYNDFLGALGAQVREGGAPTLQWKDYVDQHPFAARYGALTPEQAGRTNRSFNPMTRHIFF